MASGDLTLGWTRRTRIGGDWQDFQDVELGEDAESYEIEIRDGPTVKRTLTASTNSVLYSAANQSTDFGADQALVSFVVYQIASNGQRGYPGEFLLPYLLPGLVRAWEPDLMLPSEGDNQSLERWFDRGPIQAHLAEATNPPLFQTAEQNGLPVVEFQGGSHALSSALAAVTAGMARSVYVVYRTDSVASDLVPLVNLNHGASFADGAAFIITPDPTLRVSNGNRIWAPTTDTTDYHVLSVHLPTGGRTDEAVAWRDGAVLAVGSTASRAVNTGTNGVAIGRRNDTSVSFDGKVGDVYIYNQDHSDALKALMHRHLKSRWNTP